MPLQTLPSNEQGKNISSVFLKKKKKNHIHPFNTVKWQME